MWCASCTHEGPYPAAILHTHQSGLTGAPIKFISRSSSAIAGQPVISADTKPCIVEAAPRIKQVAFENAGSYRVAGLTAPLMHLLVLVLTRGSDTLSNRTTAGVANRRCSNWNVCQGAATASERTCAHHDLSGPHLQRHAVLPCEPCVGKPQHLPATSRPGEDADELVLWRRGSHGIAIIKA